MMNREKNKTVKLISKMLEKQLKIEANSNSCVFVYQPKVPEKLNNYKNDK
ncbi:MAG: cyclic lactone autoinducer peptide [Lachnospiraceae bacterium]|nr:cyclic lactone autoinducer peptide [Lachnospiraceae bacterium]